MIEVVLGQQLAVDHHMVLRRITIAQFFQVGAQQAAKAWIAPMLQQAIQPRAIHQFGRCNRLQKVQRMSLAGKELPRPTCLALLQVIGVLAGNIGAVLGDPVVPGRWIVREFLGQRGGALQLFAQERLREALRVLLAQQRFVNATQVAGGSDRLCLGRHRLQTCQDSHGNILGRLVRRCFAPLQQQRGCACQKFNRPQKSPDGRCLTSDFRPYRWPVAPNAPATQDQSPAPPPARPDKRVQHLAGRPPA